MYFKSVSLYSPVSFLLLCAVCSVSSQLVVLPSNAVGDTTKKKCISLSLTHTPTIAALGRRHARAMDNEGKMQEANRTQNKYKFIIVQLQQCC